MVKKIFAALFSILFLTIGLIILPKPEKEKNNMAETWVLNESLSLLDYNGSSWTINFTSNNTNYSQLNINAPAGTQQELYYGPKTAGAYVYDFPGGWIDEAYKTIVFETAPTGTLLTWLQANGTKQETDTSKKLTKLRYKVSDVCQLFDKDKYFATRTAHGVVFTNNGDGSFTINGTCDSDADADTPLFLPPTGYSITFDLYSIEGHKYLLIPLPQAFSYSTLRFIFGSQATPYYETSDTYKIFTATKTGTFSCYAIYRVGKGTTINNLTVKPQLFDLTEMYGAGNEPTTLAEFRQDFPNELYSYATKCWYSVYKSRYKISNFCQLMDKSKYPATRIFAGITFTNNGDGSFTMTGTKTGNAQLEICVADIKKGHKYLGTTGTDTFYMWFFKSDGSSIYGDFIRSPFYTATETDTDIRFFIKTDSTDEVNVTAYPQLFDLTEMYGAGNEPTTLAEFGQKYPNELYPYSLQCYLPLNKGVKI